MMKRPWEWGSALVLSCVLHAGAAVFMLPGEPDVQIAGRQGDEIVLLGSAFMDLSAAGASSEPVEPVTFPAASIEPIARDTATEPVEAASSLPIEQAPVPPAAPLSPEVSQRAELTEPEQIEPAEATNTPAEPETAAIEPLAPIETAEEAIAMLDVPRPTPRPHYEPPRRNETAEAKAVQAHRQAAQPPARRRQTQRPADSGGRDSHYPKRGAADGARAVGGFGRGLGSTNQSGNAAVSNYPGKVVAKLRRVLRYPREAQRDRITGEVRVSFVVAESGAVSSIRVVASSGYPVLDRAAVETVQRAAPFPAIPKEAGRSSWPFTVPLAFVR